MEYVTVEFFVLWTGHAQAVVRNPMGVEVASFMSHDMGEVRERVADEFGSLVRT